MNVLIVSTEDNRYGAARATYRLHQGLQETKVNSKMLVRRKHSEDSAVIGMAASSGIGQLVNGARLIVDRLPLKFYPQRSSNSHSLEWLPDRIIPKITSLDPDLINLHWTQSGYLKIETMAQFKQPIVWTLHDMWAFTGGCHYTQECDRYTASCGACIQLGSSKKRDLSNWVWQRKAKAWKNLNFTVVTPSNWLKQCAHSSSLLQNKAIEVIPNSLDTNLYRPIEQNLARKLLSLPQDKKFILFGAVGATSDKRKGYSLLKAALQELKQAGWQDRVEVLIFGASGSNDSSEFGFRVRYMGTLNDDLSLALVYSAADIFVLPSTQDNLPNTLVEAIACGIPCIAFNIGGVPDIIEHERNGYLAKPYRIEDLTKGIIWILENQQRHQKLSEYARQKAEREYRLDVQANRYQSLYREILLKYKFEKNAMANI
jgi:glycosyltransferase involved in cell wall biosynthesis